MVSEWMVNGNINEFVKAHGEVDRFKLLKDVVKGLIYMHDRVMIHGDLKGANILIDQDGHARLADFGLLTIVSDSSNPMTSSSSVKGGTIRWMSPELLDPGRFGFEHDRPTKGSDCYALGMVILEVLSGKTPFTPLKDLIVMQKVIEGERPARPEGAEGEWFTDDLWQMLNLCWATRLESRPNIGAVLECLERAPRPSTGTGNGAENNADDKPSSAANDSCMFPISSQISVVFNSLYTAGQMITCGGGKSPFPPQDCLGSVTGSVMTHGGEGSFYPN
ncbi:kinase-like protein [Thelephora ganbajun]|uniref:Kinase-like protein n=1 Tax=Thelephora ganbajun TaxID=370292 RepID=A0ACB6ZBB8_THEGA|nr:kinase-like protein [Thelephora ganbajun]